jgi:alpha-1,2-mannosyltransferase
LRRIAASPVSWTHHQVWTVLAGLLLVANGRRVQLASGLGLLLIMTLSAGELAHLGGPFLGDNARMLAALVVCRRGTTWATSASHPSACTAC